MNPWIVIVIAGIFEVGFTTFLKLSDGFTNWKYVILFVISAAFSFGLLSYAMKSIPLGSAYAIWTGIGAAGTAIIGMIYFKDPVSFGRIAFLILLVGSIVGLKFVSAK